MVVSKANNFDWEARIGKLTLKSINPNLDITSQNIKVALIFALVYVVVFFFKSFKLVYPHRSGWSRVGRGSVKRPATLMGEINYSPA